MKKHEKPQQWMAFTLVVLLLIACIATATAADYEFVFRNGVTWDTTPERLLEAEGSAEDVCTYYQGASEYTEYRYPVTKVSDFQAYPYYFFKDDRLMLIAYWFTEEFQELYVLDHLCSMIYQKYETVISKDYFSFDKDDIFSALHLNVSSMSIGDIYRVSDIRLLDDTIIYLSFGDHLIISYFIKERILPSDTAGL